MGDSNSIFNPGNYRYSWSITKVLFGYIVYLIFSDGREERFQIPCSDETLAIAMAYNQAIRKYGIDSTDWNKVKYWTSGFTFVVTDNSTEKEMTICQ